MQTPWTARTTSKSTDFDVETGDFSKLEIRDSGVHGGFYYFYDTSSNSLIKHFLLETKPQVLTLCEVKLIDKDGLLTPRIRLWKRSKKVLSVPVTEDFITEDATQQVKASVDTSGCYQNYWTLMSYLSSLNTLTIPGMTFRAVAGDDADLVEMLKVKDRSSVLAVVNATIGGKLTEADIKLLSNRKEQLEVFERLLNNSEYFEATKCEWNKAGDEAVWQEFFEQNTWIFGYGLNLIACDTFDDSKLEQITTGANIFTGGGKRNDALMKTRGYISSLLFCEIKTSDKELLTKVAYRAPDVYRPSADLAGGVAQVQKTVEKAVRGLADVVNQQFKSDGEPTGVQYSSIKPRQVLVTGSLSEFMSELGINQEKLSSFELYRRSISDVEIITFDELYLRAAFIVAD